MDRYYFRSPVGIVECLLEGRRNILSCVPCEAVEEWLVEEAIGMHPDLAEAFGGRWQAPRGYTLETLTPRWAPSFWDTLCRVPFGTTISYAELAATLGLGSGYARAVGGLLARNNHFLLLPCHRVVKGDGTMGGFKWGIDLKRKILNYERDGEANRGQ